MLFRFQDSRYGDDLFKFDGTTFGRVAHIHYSSSTSHPDYIAQLGDRAVFGADDGRYGEELWQSDGTLIGTTLHTNIAKELRTNSAAPREFVRLGRKVFFVANDGIHGSELWSSDGTAANGFGAGAGTGTGTGTKMVADLYPGAKGSNPNNLTACEAMGILLFRANDGKGSGDRVFVHDVQIPLSKIGALKGTYRTPNLQWAFASKRGDSRASRSAGGAS